MNKNANSADVSNRKSPEKKTLSIEKYLFWRVYHSFKKCFYFCLEHEEPHHHHMCVTVHSVCCCGFELKRGATVFAIIWAVLCLTIACLQLGLTGM